jgi:diaminopimelate epimerase
VKPSADALRVSFVKMSGAGNDMILVDHRQAFLRGLEASFARAACDRRDGIGADGVILLERDPDHDFFVRFFNPDGGEYELCGNGARCVPRFAHEIGFEGEVLRFRTLSGVHEARELGPGRGRVTLAVVREIRLDISVDLDGAPCTMDWGDIGGVPHGVMWVDDVDGVPIARWGAWLRAHAAFAPHGTNVSFAEVRGPGRIRIRTFERGVEGETLACGSGSAVCATIARERGHAQDRVVMEVRSGETLGIELPPRGTPRAPALEGPVRRVFEGVFELAVKPSPPVSPHR